MHEFLHAFEHSLIDSAKMLPFLLVAFAVLEYLESKIEEKSSSVIKKAKKTGPFAGALLGLIPQCGFSVIGSNFYAKRIITLGTLIAIYLSTSDEALLILLTSPDRFLDVIEIMAIKLVIGVVAGYTIDLFARKKSHEEECHHRHHNEHGCEDEELIGEEHCCSHTDWKAIANCTAKRTFSVFIFLFAVNLLFGFAIETLGEERLAEFMLTDSIFQPFLASLIGLIPNCAASVILAQMYAQGAITLGSVVAGLCTGAGAGLIVLFRVNKGLKSNLLVAALLYFIGAFSGVLIQLLQNFI